MFVAIHVTDRFNRSSSQIEYAQAETDVYNLLSHSMDVILSTDDAMLAGANYAEAAANVQRNTDSLNNIKMSMVCSCALKIICFLIYFM